MCINWLSMCVCVCCVKSVRRHKCDTTDWVARAPLTYIYTIHNSIYRRWFINYSTSTTIFVSFTSHRNIFDEAIKQHAVCSVVRFWELPFFCYSANFICLLHFVQEDNDHSCSAKLKAPDLLCFHSFVWNCFNAIILLRWFIFMLSSEACGN